jgi:hypothetical protein
MASHNVGPRNRLGKKVLFVVHIPPAALEATLTLDAWERLSLLGSRRLSFTMKNLIQQAPMVEGQVTVRVRLNNRAVVRAFSALVAMKSKLLSSDTLKGRYARNEGPRLGVR